MSFKKVIQAKGFWKSVVFMAIGFVIIYHVITMLFTFNGFQFSEYFETNLSEDRWIRFVFGSLLSGLIYGFIITYGQFSIKMKKDKRDY